MLQILQKRQKDLSVFMDNIKNEHNFSAIIRTCDSVGILNIYYQYNQKGEIPINENITMGAHKWVFLQKVKNSYQFLKNKKEEGYQIVVTHLSKESVNFRDIDYTKPTVIVVGNEMSGVSKEIIDLSDYKVIIPMYGMVQSLNVSVATGIILYEAQRQREEKGLYTTSQLSERDIEDILKKWAVEDVIKTKKESR
ncbi:MAG: tRNA (guanine-N2)-dimethyltransferase [Aquificae bacterium]|nr:tRNA (guanine-N2)-dimethyltransferase [Aquificota bacterium]